MAEEAEHIHPRIVGRRKTLRHWIRVRLEAPNIVHSSLQEVVPPKIYGMISYHVEVTLLKLKEPVLRFSTGNLRHIFLSLPLQIVSLHIEKR